MPEVFEKLKSYLSSRRTSVPGKMSKGAFASGAAGAAGAPRPAKYRELSEEGTARLEENMSRYGAEAGEKVTNDELDAWEAGHPKERGFWRDARHDMPGYEGETVGRVASLKKKQAGFKSRVR